MGWRGGEGGARVTHISHSVQFFFNFIEFLEKNGLNNRLVPSSFRNPPLWETLYPPLI